MSYSYDPYGNIRTAPGMDVPLAWWNTTTYTGADKDNQTGLIRLGIRWYDPNTGRFTTPDPTTQETNPYLYALGNPGNFIDPTGGISVCTLRSGAAGLAASYATRRLGVPGMLLSAYVGAVVGEACSNPWPKASKQRTWPRVNPSTGGLY